MNQRPLTILDSLHVGEQNQLGRLQFSIAILLVVLFAGGSYFNWFPLRGLTSPGWEEFSLGHKILDYFWHLALPVTAMVIGGFATLTMLTKNSFLDEVGKQYVTTARAKGQTESGILYRHVFRNAMLLIIAGFPEIGRAHV